MYYLAAIIKLSRERISLLQHMLSLHSISILFCHSCSAEFVLKHPNWESWVNIVVKHLHVISNFIYCKNIASDIFRPKHASRMNFWWFLPSMCVYANISSFYEHALRNNQNSAEANDCQAHYMFSKYFIICRTSVEESKERYRETKTFH